MQPLAREHPIAHRKSLPWRWHGQRRRKNFLTQRSFCHQLRGNIFNRFQVTCEVHKHTRDSVDCYRCWWIRDIHPDLVTCPIMRHGSRRWHEVPYSPKLRDDFCGRRLPWSAILIDLCGTSWGKCASVRHDINCPNIRLRLSATYSCCQRCQRVPPNGPPNFCLRLCKISNGTCTVSVVLKSHSLQVRKKGHS